MHISISTSYGFLALFQYLEKTNDSIPKKNTHTDKRTKRWMEEMNGQTLFYRTLLAATGGQEVTCWCDDNIIFDIAL